MDTKELQWNLTDLYKNISDPQMEKDVQGIESACMQFEKKYAKEVSYLEDNAKLLLSLNDYVKILHLTSPVRPLWYLYNMQSIESGNPKIGARISLLDPLVTNALNRIIFFQLKLAKLSDERKKNILSAPELSEYRYFLKIVFDASKYDLTEETEKALNLVLRPATDMWSESFSKLLNQQVVTFKGKEIPIAAALNKIHQLDTTDRRKLDSLVRTELSKISYLAEREINAVYTTKKITDELRGYKKPYEATILGYQNSVSSIENLIETVTKNFTVSHKFYKLKQKILKLPSMKYCDRAVGVSKKQKEVSFEEGCDILRQAFGAVDPEYVEILNKMLKDKKIDVYPRVGKQGGAYCWGGYNAPTLVMLNHVPSVDSVLTFAHEMGHAIHTELSNKQSVLYSSYTISVAEVASTFFENLAFKKIYEESSEKDKFYLLYDRVADSIQTIFRQTACFNFEKDLHEAIRTKGEITAKEMAILHNKNMKAYLGPAFKMEEADGYFFEAWSHIRRHFYVYSYAYGEIISKALYRKCEKDPEYFKTVKKFMLAGKSMSPDDIFKSIGLDTTKPEFFKLAIDGIEADIQTLTKQYAKLLKK